ncbi:unnamed protein product, partial [Rotaria magnacalcarata]
RRYFETLAADRFSINYISALSLMYGARSSTRPRPTRFREPARSAPLNNSYPPNALLPTEYRMQPISLREYTWRRTWPHALTNGIAVLMLILTLAVVILEVVHLCLTTVAEPFKPVGTTAAGFWCSLFYAIAALFILIANLMKRNSFIWVTIAFILTIISLAFCGVLIGFDAKTVSKYNFDLSPKIKFIGAQLGFACGVALLDIIFLLIYFVTLCLTTARYKTAEKTIPPYVQPYG